MKTSILSLVLVCLFALTTNVKAQSRLAVGTQVTMGDDTRKGVESITVGDEVLSYNKATMTYDKKKVTGIDKIMQNRMVRVAMENQLQVLVTKDCLFWSEKGWASIDPESVTKNEKYTPVKQCNLGDYVYFYDILSTGSERVAILEGVLEPIAAYSLKIEGGGSIIANGFIIGTN